MYVPGSGSILIIFDGDNGPEIFINAETYRDTLDLHRWLDRNFGLEILGDITSGPDPTASLAIKRA